MVTHSAERLLASSPPTAPRVWRVSRRTSFFHKKNRECKKNAIRESRNFVLYSIACSHPHRHRPPDHARLPPAAGSRATPPGGGAAAGRCSFTPPPGRRARAAECQLSSNAKRAHKCSTSKNDQRHRQTGMLRGSRNEKHRGPRRVGRSSLSKWQGLIRVRRYTNRNSPAVMRSSMARGFARASLMSSSLRACASRRSRTHGHVMIDEVLASGLQSIA